MKLLDILLLGLSLAFLIIGIDQLMKLGFTHAYWAFMVALVPFFIFNLRRSRKKETSHEAGPKTAPKKRSSSSKKPQ